jgi:hypothetical protein
MKLWLFALFAIITETGAFWHAYDHYVAQSMKNSRKCVNHHRGIDREDATPSDSHNDHHNRELDNRHRRHLQSDPVHNTSTSTFQPQSNFSPRIPDNNREFYVAKRWRQYLELQNPPHPPQQGKPETKRRRLDTSSDVLADDEQMVGAAHCPCYHNATRPYSKAFITALSLWEDLAPNVDNLYESTVSPYQSAANSSSATMSLPNESYNIKSNNYYETLYGSQWALEEIHRNQNPENCSTAKYLVSGGWPYGFGSRVHVEGVGLAIAMHLDRVFLVHPDGDNIFWETNVPFCRNVRKDTTLGCFYEPMSSKCTIQDAIKASGFAKDVNSFRTYYATDFQKSFLDGQ